MKKVLFIALAMLNLLFVSCNKEDDRDAFVGTYSGTLSVKGTVVIDNEDYQPVNEKVDGVFIVDKDGKKGKRVAVKIVGVDYGSLTGSVDGNVLTLDAVHMPSIDLVFEPAQLSNNHITVNGSIRALTITEFGTEELKAAILVEADKQ